MGKPNQLGSEFGVASGRMKNSSRSLQAFVQQRGSCARRASMKPGSFLQLRTRRRRPACR